VDKVLFIPKESEESRQKPGAKESKDLPEREKDVIGKKKKGQYAMGVFTGILPLLQ